MRIFLDTANVARLKQAAKLGIVTGVATNPGLVSKAGAHIATVPCGVLTQMLRHPIY